MISLLHVIAHIQSLNKIIVLYLIINNAAVIKSII